MFVGSVIYYIILCLLLCLHIHVLTKSRRKTNNRNSKKQKHNTKEIKIGSVVKLDHNSGTKCSTYTVEQIEHKDGCIYLMLHDYTSDEIIKVNLNNVVKLY